MPGWVQGLVVLGVLAVGVVGLGVAVETRRLRHCLTAIEPQLRHLTLVFENWPNHFGVLDEILAQFRTNSGHTLRDLVNKLFTILTALVPAVARLEEASEVAVATADRMESLIGRLDLKVTVAAASGLRIEREQQDVADSLRTAQQAVDDLAAARIADHERADLAGSTPGEAADAASRSPEEMP